jgi:hypothetical protein
VFDGLVLPDDFVEGVPIEIGHDQDHHFWTRPPTVLVVGSDKFGWNGKGEGLSGSGSSDSHQFPDRVSESQQSQDIDECGRAMGEFVIIDLAMSESKEGLNGGNGKLSDDDSLEG